MRNLSQQESQMKIKIYLVQTRLDTFSNMFFYTHAILANNLNQFTKTQGVGSVTTGVGIATAIAVWPYVAAYVRGKISKEKLEIALIKVFPEAGKELAYRIGFIAIFGPIYAWWILAKTAMSLTPSPKDNIGKIRYITINN